MDINNNILLFYLDTINIIWLGLALFLAGLLEALLWKTPLFNLVNFPIHSQLFGENKKWRGLISLPITHLVSVGLFQIGEQNFLSIPNNLIAFSSFNWLEYGLLVGFIFNLSELPNSFIKRRLQIPPGDESNKLFVFFDNMDSTYGTLILWYLYFKFPLHLILTGFLITPFLYMGTTLIRKNLGLKS